MRRYETIIIIDPDLSEEDRAPVFERFKDIIPQEGGFLILFDGWGIKRLAYEIKKKPRGYYLRLDFCGTGPLVDEIERFCRIDDRVLKYMTVLLEKDADVERIKEDMAKAEAEARAKAEARAEAEARAAAEAEAEAAAKAEAEAAAKDQTPVKMDASDSDEEVSAVSESETTGDEMNPNEKDEEAS